jgi:hypothetical protein
MSGAPLSLQDISADGYLAFGMAGSVGHQENVGSWQSGVSSVEITLKAHVNLSR